MDEFLKLLSQTKNASDHAQTMLKYHPELTEYYTILAEPGKKFIRIVQQYNDNRSHYVMYFVDKSTGVIYGSESYKKPNFKRQYGTLDTIHEWDWSPYYAVSLKGINTLVPPSQRRTATI